MYGQGVETQALSTRGQADVSSRCDNRLTEARGGAADDYVLPPLRPVLDAELDGEHRMESPRASSATDREMGGTLLRRTPRAVEVQVAPI